MDTKLIVLSIPLIIGFVWVVKAISLAKKRKSLGLCHFCGCKLGKDNYIYTNALDNFIYTKVCIACSKEPKKTSFMFKLFITWLIISAAILRVDYLQ